MFSKWLKTLLFCLSFTLVSSCGSNGDGDNNEQQAAQIAGLSPGSRIALSSKNIGPINAKTPFNIHHITQAFQGLNVSQQTSFQKGEAYPIIRIAKGAKTLMTINPTSDESSIYSIVIEDNLVRNELGHRLSTQFSDIYSFGKVEKCLAGKEELSGKTICYAPNSRNILYIFTGRWNGPDGEIPPEDVLSTWTLDAIIWKPAG
ncbi:MAG: DUF1131 family protein [Cocleimonas sp.]|nr:DUF1131 family protein [Cocleimonas sp.]